jgi:hypothetical protein
MRHRIARLFEPLRRLLRRPRRDLSGPLNTAYVEAPYVAVPGIGIGSYGQPAGVVRGKR